MSQVVDNTNIAPLAEVTKSRPSLENSLNNASTTQKSPTTSSSKKGKKNKNHSTTEKEVEQPTAEVQPSSIPNAKAHSKDYIRPWSSMTTQELAQWARDTGLDQDEEGAAVPSRRRMPKNTQVKTTTTTATVPNTPVSANPTSRKQPSSSYTNARSAGSSPLYAQPSIPSTSFPQFPQCGGSPTMVPSSSSFEQMSLQQTFSNGSMHAPTGRSSTPPEEFLSHQQQAPAADEAVYVVSTRRNNPYAFDVIGESQHVMGTTAVNAYYFSNSLMNASLDSESTVGYVNSAEVSPVKAGQQREGSSSYSQMTFTAYPHRRVESDDAMNQSTASDSNLRKHQRVYVNGRPVIKA